MERRQPAATAAAEEFLPSLPESAFEHLAMAGVPWKLWRPADWCLPVHRDRLRGAFQGMAAGDYAVSGMDSQLIPAACRIADSMLQWKPGPDAIGEDRMPLAMDRVPGGSDARALIAEHGVLVLVPVVLMDGLTPSRALPNMASAAEYLGLDAAQQKSLLVLTSLLCSELVGRPVDRLFEQPKDARLDLPLPVPKVTGLASMAKAARAADPAQIAGEDPLDDSLQRAVWALAQAADFGEGLATALSAGGDRATVAVLYGLLAGALFGEPALTTEHWERLTYADPLEWLSEELYLTACASPGLRSFAYGGRRDLARRELAQRLRELWDRSESDVDHDNAVRNFLYEHRFDATGDGWGALAEQAIVQEWARQARVTAYMAMFGLGWPEVPPPLGPPPASR